MTKVPQLPPVPVPIHPFPARMAASIPWNELRPPRGRRLRVLDPMAGSGTTLVVARALGHESIGFDTDPLAVLLASVWCDDIRKGATLRAAERVHALAVRRARSLSLAEAYPANADEETRRFARYWFDPTNRRQLTALAAATHEVSDRRIRNILWCAFSRLIITKQAGASRALDMAHSRPHRADSKATIVRPFSAFLGEVTKVLNRVPFPNSAAAAPSQVRRGDARALPLRDRSVDVVITSPPYLNGIDYQRATKFTLVWMGHTVSEMRKIRGENIGTEAGGKLEAGTDAQTAALKATGSVSRLSERTVSILRRYIRDMDTTLHEIARVLRKNGRAVVVIGDSTVRGTYIRNSQALLVLAEACGLRPGTVTRRRLPPNRRYLPPPRAAEQLDVRLRTEAVLRFRKTA